MNEVVVVVPIYKETPTDLEYKSFQNTLNVLCNHPIAIVCPKSLNVDFYKNEDSQEIMVQRFPDHYFIGIESYNQLCLSQEFYQRFSEYNYMLICHVDAWVFRDELLYWCKKGYEYIGAPLHHRQDAVGNGGFCLRKNERMIEILDRNRTWINLRWYIRNFDIRHPKHMLKRFANVCGYHNTMGWLLDRRDLNEDVFLSMVLKDTINSLYTPDWSEATKFSIESCPEYYLGKNNFYVPFGCHGHWHYWNKGLWEQLVSQNEQYVGVPPQRM